MHFCVLIKAFAEEKFVSRIVNRPYLRLARAVAVNMVDDVKKAALESAEQHSVA